jgi:hypothetical protein
MHKPSSTLSGGVVPMSNVRSRSSPGDSAGFQYVNHNWQQEWKEIRHFRQSKAIPCASRSSVALCSLQIADSQTEIGDVEDGS